MLRTLFFDLDGTLVDTEVLAVRALEESYREWAISIDASACKAVVGRTWESALESLFRLSPPPVDPAHASRYIREKYRKLVEQELRPMDGVREALQGLAPEFEIFVVSGSGREEIQRALLKTGLDRSVREFLGVEDYGESKPSPVPYREALKRFRARPEATVVFEDSKAGVDSALAAGLRVIGVQGQSPLGENVARATSQIESVARLSPAWLRSWDAAHPSPTSHPF